MNLHHHFHPIVATPFRNDSGYWEVLPCEALRPIVRCFWFSLSVPGPATLVVPDACMDILFTVDASTRRISARFCGMNDAPFYAPANMPGCFTFGVRFFAWSAALFAEESLRDTKNACCDAERHFPSLVSALSPRLARSRNFAECVAQAEACLPRALSFCSPDDTLMNAVWSVLHSHGNLRAGQLARDSHISPRQLERLFAQHIGVSPKGFASLVRYQSLWREAVFSSHFDVLDAVERYGYVDQAHLLNSFKQFHSLSLRDALAKARQNVGFLQAGAPLI